MSTRSDRPSLQRQSPATLVGLLPAFYEFVGGAALAVGVLGITRGGADVWLGTALVVVAVPLTLKGRQTAARVAEEAVEELREQLGAGVAADVERVLVRRGLFAERRSWWGRLFGR